MQQTQNYKLNLIETSDPISPAPLNENAEKLEAALLVATDALRAETAAETAALDARVQVLELHKFYVGSYIGTGEKSGDSQMIKLGFTPLAVISNPPNTYRAYRFMCYTGMPTSVMEIVPGGFKVGMEVSANSSALDQSLNSKNVTYGYIAFA